MTERSGFFRRAAFALSLFSFLFIFFLLFNLAAPGEALAVKECLVYRQNVVCPKDPNGGIVFNVTGQPKCGLGACVLDRSGVVRCSSVPGGGAALNTSGNPKCEGGCVNGDFSNCLTIR
jgi:hypothetical protein